jgi:hypothetical protein
MAERLDPARYDRFHHFLSDGLWDEAPLEAELARCADRLVGGPDAVLVIDDTSMPKKGSQSVEVCEQGHQQMKEELGLDHFGRRSWRGLHHHALMTMIAYAFLQHRRPGSGRRRKKPAAGTSQTNLTSSPQGCPQGTLLDIAAANLPPLSKGHLETVKSGAGIELAKGTAFSAMPEESDGAWSAPHSLQSRAAFGRPLQRRGPVQASGENVPGMSGAGSYFTASRFKDTNVPFSLSMCGR